MVALRKTEVESTATTKPKSTLRPVKDVLSLAMQQADLSNLELARRVGYSGSVIAMLKAGDMKLPMNRIGSFASALNIDPVYLAMCVDREGGYGLGAMIESISRRTAITLNEEKLITAMRKIAGGADIDMDDHLQEREAMLAAFGQAAQRVRTHDENTLHHLEATKKISGSRHHKKDAPTAE